MRERLNIVYIHSHDTGRYVQPYGFAVDTPNIQRLAEQGVLFRHAFCANPTCSPSRAALLTGSWPHSNGMLGLTHRGSALDDYQQHLARFLRSQGYVTALAGTQHEASGPDRQALLGYDQMLDQSAIEGVDPGVKEDEYPGHRASRFLDGVDRAQPFFLACGFGLTHRNGGGPGGVQWHNERESPLGDPRYVRPPLPLPDTPQTRQDFADFRVAANRLDRAMGVVFDALERNGLAENTLVLCTTDHGIAFPFMKCNLTDHGTGVMLIVRGPGGFTGGKVVDALVSQVDLFPTVCEVARIEKPAWLQGVSLTPLVDGSKESVREEVFSELNFHAAPEPARTVRTARYRYVRRYLPQETPVLSNVDPSPSKVFMIENGWRTKHLPAEALYDTMFDPTEVNNVASDPSYADVLRDLRSRMDRWMRETNDPLLSGVLEVGPQMRLNRSDGLSPGDKERLPAGPIGLRRF